MDGSDVWLGVRAEESLDGSEPVWRMWVGRVQASWTVPVVTTAAALKQCECRPGPLPR